MPNCQINLVIAPRAQSLLFWNFISTTSYHLGRYEPLSPISCHAPWLGKISWSQGEHFTQKLDQDFSSSQSRIVRVEGEYADNKTTRGQSYNTLW